MGAPQVTIETITVTRPLKVIAFTCCAFTVILMISACSTSDWMQTDGWREGLFSQCIGPEGMLPVPFADSRMIGDKEQPEESKPGCYRGRGTSYLRGAAALVIIGLFTDFFGTLLTGLGLRSTDPNKKYKYYRVAIYALIVAVVALLLAAIIYPVQFSKDFHDEPKLTGLKWDEDRKVNDLDFDNDGIPDSEDLDDDQDGINDDVDDDDDNDGITDDLDLDDDNDGIPDDKENLDVGELGDLDGDGTLDEEDDDIDGDGTLNEEDPDDDNDGVMDVDDGDDDNDGVLDTKEDDDDDDDDENAEDDNGGDEEGGDDEKTEPEADALIATEGDDDDTAAEGDDEGDGEPGEEVAEENKGGARVYSFGFGYGATWGSIVLIFASVVLLICDRESEEIYYKEKQVEEDEEEGGED